MFKFHLESQVAGCWLLVAGCWLLVAGYWLLVAGYWLLVAGYWLLVKQMTNIKISNTSNNQYNYT
jgi:hypothetical protein